ncbi:MAG: peptidylprolyl isomerase [Alphaproteobacteria bacterium]
MTKKLHMATLALALAALALPVHAQDAAAGADPVVGKIAGKPILRSEVITEIQRLGPQAAQVPPQMVFPQVLDRIIVTKVVSAAGYAKGVQDSAEVKDQMKRAEREIVAQAYIRQAVEPMITEEKIKARYDELVKAFKPVDEMRARHILVKTESEANAVLKEIKGGGDFAKIAMDKSVDDGSKKQGGDLGYFTKADMVKPFAEAAFAMKPGQVSDKPVKTDFGWHVIKVEDKRQSSPPPIDTVRNQIKNQLGQELTAKVVQDMVKDAKVERFNFDGTPMPPPSDAVAKKQ